MQIELADFSEKRLTFNSEWATLIMVIGIDPQEGEEKMKRALYKRNVAVWALTVCWVAALSVSSSGAWALEPRDRGQVESMVDKTETREVSFWSMFRTTLVSLWEKASVMIDPTGQDGEGEGEGNEGEGSQEGESEDGAGNGS